MARTIEIEDMITVGTLAERLQLPATRLIGELMKNGVMATINERIDFDTAQIIVEELGLEVELAKKNNATAAKGAGRPKRYGHSDKAVARPPVVAVMGHVDHGKTSLLDAIRNTQVAASEAGGITQHISAYQVFHKDRAITFLDTPGHEAFAAIRQHGAFLTDIAIIMVAADDGIKPQTLEAIRFARKASVKIIIALSKVDKEEADPNRIKQQLAEQQLLPEEWGGDTVVVEVSAKTGQGLDTLLDMILLVADVEEFKADVESPARGLIIESHLDHGRGPVANALIEEGVLKVGDFVVAGTTYAKIRSLQSTDGLGIKQASPSTPVTVTGFKALPQFGNEFIVVKNEKEARLQAEKSTAEASLNPINANMSSSELIRIMNRKKQVQEFNVVVRADVQGSLTSVLDSLKSLDTDEVSVHIITSGVGAITESDIHYAATSGAIIYGFNVELSTPIQRLARRDKVSIRLYKVIYELIDDVKEELGRLLVPEVVETGMGRLVVKAIFKTTKSEIICGGEVTKGRLVVPAFARLYRGKEQLGEVEATRLQRGPQEAKEVLEGEMCGVSLKTDKRLDLEEGDRLEFFTRQIVARKL